MSTRYAITQNVEIYLFIYSTVCVDIVNIDEKSLVMFFHLGDVSLLSQGYQKTKLVATLKKFYWKHHDLVNPYNVAVSRIVSDVFASDAP